MAYLSKETQYKASIFKSTNCLYIRNSSWVLMDVLLRACSFVQNVDIAQYWQLERANVTRNGFRNFACSFLLLDDHFGHEAAYDRLGPWLFGNNPSQCGSSVHSVHQTHLPSCPICCSSSRQLLSLSFCCYCHCSGSNFLTQSTLLYFGVPKHTKSNIIAHTLWMAINVFIQNNEQWTSGL